VFSIVCNLVLCIPGFGCPGVVFPFDLVKGFFQFVNKSCVVDV
jgi:hypothetical protein